MFARWINTAWYLSCHSEWRRFKDALRNTRAAQEQLLLDLLRRNSDSEYGKRYRFSEILNADEFRQRVPIVRYEGLTGYVERIAQGEQGVLTTECVERLVPTGGSTGGAKLVPYTDSLKRAFQRAIAVWVCSTFQTHPNAMNGRSYWSITPMGNSQRKTPSGLPIGFESDSEYLSRWSQRLASKLILPPPQLAQLSNIENARYANLLFMLACQDLALISVWSPTFLTALFHQLDDRAESLFDDLRDGVIRWPQPEAGLTECKVLLRPDPPRSSALRRRFHQAATRAEFFRDCWPKLALISCWADGNSASYLNDVEQLLPFAQIQPKGLLATEAVVSIPWKDGGASALAIRSHFFEFVSHLEPTSQGQQPSLLAHELRIGERYRVVVTTGGGMYRYDLGDVVEVTGFEAACPLIRFVGRAEATSDMVGEKLHENQVRLAIDDVLMQEGVRLGVRVLVPRRKPTPWYSLVLSRDVELPEARRAGVAARLDKLLRENPQYDLARRLNQLAEIQVDIVPLSSAEICERFEDWQSQMGRRVGEIKASVLDYRGDWSGFLAALRTSSCD